MISRPTSRLCIALGITLLTAGTAAAQSLAYSDATAPPGEALSSAYRLKLESAWPQAGRGESCRNGGDEVVEGVLRRGVDGVYHGSFERRTLLLFCGAHGAGGEACEIVLEGDGKVVMTGYVVTDETGRRPALRLSWHPAPAHGASVRGACSAEFKRSVEAMYLSVPHGLELPVPAAGAGKRRERLEDYAWTAELAAQ
jgi:hypothetical protein